MSVHVESRSYSKNLIFLSMYVNSINKNHNLANIRVMSSHLGLFTFSFFSHWVCSKIFKRLTFKFPAWDHHKRKVHQEYGFMPNYKSREAKKGQ